MKRLIMLTLVLLCASSSLAAEHEARSVALQDVLSLQVDDPTFTEDWEGVWSSQNEEFTCQDQSLGVTSSTDEICAGQAIGLPAGTVIPGGEVSCTGTVTSSMIDVTCNASWTFDPGCTTVYTIEIDGTLSGNSASITTEINTSTSGTPVACSFIPSTCSRFVTTSTRTAQEPDCSGVPTGTSSWGTMKSRFP